VSLLILAEGLNGQIELYPEMVRIKRKGLRALLNMGMKGDKDIRIDAITAVQFKSAGLMSGYIQFTLPGGNESRGGWLDAGTDENTVIFNSRQEAKFQTVRAKIDQLRSKNPAAVLMPTGYKDPIPPGFDVVHKPPPPPRPVDGPGKYKIDGVDKESQMDTTVYVTARSKAAAKIKAELQGMIVAEMELIEPAATGK
jgi:hypothetical protein